MYSQARVSGGVNIIAENRTAVTMSNVTRIYVRRLKKYRMTGISPLWIRLCGNYVDLNYTSVDPYYFFYPSRIGYTQRYFSLRLRPGCVTNDMFDIMLT